MRPVCGDFIPQRIGEVLGIAAAIVKTIVRSRHIAIVIRCQVAQHDRQSLAHPFPDLLVQAQAAAAVSSVKPDADVVKIASQILAIALSEDFGHKAVFGFGSVAVDQRRGNAVSGAGKGAIHIQSKHLGAGIPHRRVLDPDIDANLSAVVGTQFQGVDQLVVLIAPPAIHAGADVRHALNQTEIKVIHVHTALVHRTADK